MKRLVALQKVLLLLIAMTWSAVASALTFSAPNENGITINYITTNNGEVSVSSGHYSGRVVIPSSVEHNGTTYSVTGIRSDAFWMEHTCLAAMIIVNAYVIGTHTYGAFSPKLDLDGDDNHFAIFGKIGDPSLKTSSFYIKMPFAAFVTYDGKIIEGKGVEPDIIVHDDDVNREKQLDAALDFITTLNK